MDEKRITIRFPVDLWKRLKLEEIDGKIQSINQAALDGVQLLLDSLEPPTTS